MSNLILCPRENSQSSLGHLSFARSSFFFAGIAGALFLQACGGSTDIAAAGDEPLTTQPGSPDPDEPANAAEQPSSTPGGGASTPSGQNPGGGTHWGANSEAPCVEDSDCLLVGVTNAPCYGGCTLPRVTNQETAAAETCLVPWEGDSAPQAPDGCVSDWEGCTDDCAVAPACSEAVCEGGVCKIKSSNDPDNCADCEALNKAREEALSAARSCEGGENKGECYSTVTVQDECGCEQIVNLQNEEALQAAVLAYFDWSDVCEKPDYCGDCPIPPPVLPSCINDGQGGGVCGY